MTDETIAELAKNSEFYHFGILPSVCIHSLIEDEYSKMYIPRQSCECSCEIWIDGKMDIVKPINGYTFPKKDVHRCADCNEVRMADHIGVKDDQ